MVGGYPKHLLGQHVPSKGKLGGFSLRGKNFPSEGSFSLENSFPFPLECAVFPGNEGFGEKGLLRLEEKS